MSKTQITPANDLGLFFKDLIKSVSKKQGVELSTFTQDYLSQVLERFSILPTFEVPTLAVEYLEASQKPLMEQFSTYQKLGDTSLFSSGFFAERIERSMVDLDYFSAIGARSYERAGSIRDSLAHEKQLNVYFELAKQFQKFVNLFHEIAIESKLTSDREVLGLYEKWMEKGSHTYFRILAERGIIAVPKKRDDEVS